MVKGYEHRTEIIEGKISTGRETVKKEIQINNGDWNTLNYGDWNTLVMKHFWWDRSSFKDLLKTGHVYIREPIL